ncbi:hypothetical protein M408DRAFT_59666 [Serendipita vermifera MAFF 305830]|uniref:Zn(2)-C6 fungal-type domain-containing protein n=1 Tax=Serendipita vermifera MAFF 305830 TaxID=933852 RepID=A0A0C3BSC5_SERVB|nr:hypothetical protein M408DRAFT_59666 [Serendipita vermifera MAFF 305830]
MFTSSDINFNMAPLNKPDLLAPKDSGPSQDGIGPAPSSSKAKNCAECRRLKVKCDRKVPCQNCLKRGCPSICPDSVLVARGNKLILANTEDLHQRLEQYSLRIRELETALSSLQAKHSDDPHPLLSPDQLLTGSIRKEEEDPNDAPVTSFGSLMIGGDGTAKYFGATSGAEWVIPLEDDTAQQGYSCAPVSVKGNGNPFKGASDLDLVNGGFPGPVDADMLDIPALKKMVIAELPPRDRAISLINTYYSRVAWQFDPIRRTRLINEFFVPCYENVQDPPISPHGVALLYAIFGLVCLWPVLDLALASGNRGSYSALLKLDKKIRDWTLPIHLRVAKHTVPEERQTAYIFQRTSVFMVREIGLMCLHRSYFARALLEPPFDPLRGQYSRSVLAAYASACAVLGRIRTLYAREPIIMARFPFFWTHSFSAAVILGAIVTRAPDCPLAATALVEFDHAVEMFKRARNGYRAGRLLPVLLDLQSKAKASKESFERGTWSRPTESDPALFPGLGGCKAIVHQTRQQPAASPASSTEENNVLASLGNVQPTLDDYLRSFQQQPGNSNTNVPMGITSSDDFLRGALTGDWAGLAPTQPDSTMPDLTGRYNPAPATLNVSWQDPYNTQPMQQNGSGMFASSPYSDSSMSSGSNGNNLQSNFAYTPPFQSFGKTPPANTASLANGQSEETIVLWDNFLRDLGLQNVPN